MTQSPEVSLPVIEEQLKRAGIRITAPRRIILEAVLAYKRPFTAEDLLARVRKIDGLISHATVYRSLSAFEQSGVLFQTESADGKRRYQGGEPAKTRVYVLCRDCGQTFPLKDDCLDVRQRFLVRQEGFLAQEMTLRIHAECEEYRRKGLCQRSGLGVPEEES